MNKAKIIIFVTVFLDVAGLGIVVPSLPIYLENITKSAFAVGLVFSVYALFGFLVGPLLGSLSDRYGRRPILLISIFGTSIGWFVFALGSLPLIVLGRVINGITSGNISIAQSYLTDISKDPRDRIHNLGMMGAIFGIGFVIGPAIGAALSSFSITLPFWAAGFLALFNTIAAYFLLPETHINRNANHPLAINPLGGIKRAFSNKTVRALLIIWFFYGMTMSSFHSVFSLYTHMAYDMDAAKNGLILTGIGLIMAINQGLLLKHFWLKFWTESKLQITSNIMMIVALAMIAVGNIWIMFIGIFLQSIAQPLLRVVSNSEISGAAPSRERGEILGVYQSLFFLSAIVTPLIGGKLLDIALPLPWIVGISYMIGAFVMLLLHYKNIAKIKATEPIPDSTMETEIE